MSDTRPQRKNMRLRSHDYTSAGAYFLTLCTQEKKLLLCRIDRPSAEGDAPTVLLSPLGEIVDEMLRKTPGIDKYVIMPNHVHMIVMNDESGVSIARKVQYFKSNVTRKAKCEIWQREYYDHVIRDERDYLIKWKYIDDNPARWTSDDYYITE